MCIASNAKLNCMWVYLQFCVYLFTLFIPEYIRHCMALYLNVSKSVFRYFHDRQYEMTLFKCLLCSSNTFGVAS